MKGLNPDDFESEQVWYDSPDGTKIPMFIVRHKSTPLDGTAPAIQYGTAPFFYNSLRVGSCLCAPGYGGFSISINPFFSPPILTFLQKYRGVLAVPNIRGGGEFGEAWHWAGAKEDKVITIGYRIYILSLTSY